MNLDDYDKVERPAPGRPAGRPPDPADPARSLLVSRLRELARVAGVFERVARAELGPDPRLRLATAGAPPDEEQLRTWSAAVSAELDGLLPALARQGITVLSAEDLVGPALEEARAYFTRHLLPMLTPMTVDAAHPFPRLRDGLVCLVVFTPQGGVHGARARQRYALVPVPSHARRWVRLASAPGTWRVVPVEEVVRVGLAHLYGPASQGCHLIRVVRPPAEGGVPAPARLEHGGGVPADILARLKAGLALDDAACHLRDAPLAAADLGQLCDQLEAWLR